MYQIQRLVSIFLLVVIPISGHTTHGKDSDNETVRLTTHKSLEREMKKGDTHSYRISLEQGKFLYVRVEQRGIDVIIRVLDPVGKVLEEIDSPTGDQGTETVMLVSKASGDFTLEIAPFDPLTKPGKYKLTVESVTDAATTSEGRIDQLFIPWSNKNTPGAALAVVRDGKIIFKKGYGMANLEYDIKITPQTVFHMASVSKQFTAFSIAYLARQGNVSLEDDIRKYLPELPDFDQPITIRHLIHHTSGLRDQWSLLMIAGWRLDDVITREHILKMVSRQKELNFTPGDQYNYCNTGYTLLAEIVARVSDMSFSQWTKQNIFDPLNMHHTLFYDDHEKIVKNRAYSYYQDTDENYKKSVLSYANVGATSLFTTAEDLAKWAMNFDNPVVGDFDLIKQMEQKGILNNNDTIDYAFGQGVGRYKGLKFIDHSGGDAGYRTYLGRFPDQKFSVMVMSNLASFNPGSLALKVADIYLEDLLVEEEVVTNQPDFTTIEIDPEVLETYTGQFATDPGEEYRVRRNGRQLNILPPGSGWQNMYPVNMTKFLLINGESSNDFVFDENKNVIHIRISHEGNEFIAKKMEPFVLTQDKMSEYCGNYYSEELLTSYTIVHKDSVLVMQHQRNSDFILRQVRSDIFFGGDNGIEFHFERNPEGRISGFRLDTGRVERLLFIRQ